MKLLPEIPNVLVLDCWAVLAYLNKEPGWKMIKTIFEDAQRHATTVLLHKINLGEIYYILIRRFSQGNADKIITWFLLCPIILVDLRDDILFEAAKMKAHYPMSYADCFVAATAIANNGSILTGDPEFKKIDTLVKITWVPIQ